MTTPDELQRVVERLNADLYYANNGPTAVTQTPDLRLIPSERAELLATVERMRVALEKIASPNMPSRAGYDYARGIALAALTTGEGK